MSQLDDVLSFLDADKPNALERYFELIRIQSISTDPAYAAECRRAAEVVAAEFRDLGFDASVRDTPKHPMVVGHYKVAGPDKPHVLFYAHYDVQPIDPIELWQRPPFEPQIGLDENGHEVVFARGASDDKANLRIFMEACRAWMTTTGKLPINITIFLEGEEESGSPSLVPFLEANREELDCDFAFIGDSGMWDRDTPQAALTLRGMVSEEIIITAASRDLHSGGYGPIAQNPNRIVARLLAGLHDENNRVTLPGFYDGVPAVSPEMLASWQTLGFSEEDFLAKVGLKHSAGEPGYSFLEMLWARPTCEFNGMIGGYTGPGFKTVIPSQASAKISFRLVAQQDPTIVRESFRAYVNSMLPADCSVEFIAHGASPAVSVPFESVIAQRTMDGLAEEWDKPAVFTGMGGSIPVTGYMKTVLGLDALPIGFASKDDQIHAPNERFELRSFYKGARAWARALDNLSTVNLK